MCDSGRFVISLEGLGKIVLDQADLRLFLVQNRSFSAKVDTARGQSPLLPKSRHPAVDATDVTVSL